MIGTRRFKTILVPMDYSRHARCAVDVAAELARRAGPALLVLVHAYQRPVLLESYTQAQRRSMLQGLSLQNTDELERIMLGLQDSEDLTFREADTVATALTNLRGRVCAIEGGEIPAAGTITGMLRKLQAEVDDLVADNLQMKEDIMELKNA